MKHLLERNLLPWRTAPTWHIAFSGGLDSTVLLHLLATTADTPPLHAIHIHHGLQAAADAWPAHCQAVCDELGVPLSVVSVAVGQGGSVEEAARQARYQAFEQQLRAGEVLFVAQHRDDQAETLLFRLLRGAGVRGLAAMAGDRSLGQGRLVRPLLQVSRAELQRYAQAHGLQWIEDPSNADTQFSRNYLRGEVLPVIEQRWPQAAGNLARSAAHLGEALGLLEELAVQDLLAAERPSPWPWLALPSLQLDALQALSAARQRNALQAWLAPRTRLPDSQHWVGWQTLRDARGDAAPVWRLEGGELHRAGGRIWWLSGLWLQPVPAGLAWGDPARALELPGNGQLRCCGVTPQGQVQVRYRQGGEALQVPGRGGRDLKRLLNESGLPPFVRARLPLLFVDGQLQAVANLPAVGREGLELKWQPPTNVQRLR
ncbi:tRNA lysidine(34) synthetase TilS [Pseudomonas abieticivorans]|uniref:tRNA lysidine(34) synthetase TilS n=1 Tax=Pseudomonas abieticivorans TaxID=2931382 RepID=UPI0020BE9E96|nr:tRNA lysidine(34) synthetase TilS [Pseudomonas sp. PIA16]